jgi:hypothetical protein
MAIAINHDIKLPSSLGTLYSPSGEDLGTIENELQLFDVQIQVCRESATGYYIIWNDEKIDIGPNGEFSSWPENWCDQSQGAFVELTKLRFSKNNKVDPIPESTTRSWRQND